MAHIRTQTTVPGRSLGASPEKAPRESFAMAEARKRAMVLAAEVGVEIERYTRQSRLSDINVWPPDSLSSESDPYVNDHNASDWLQALTMVEAYVDIIKPQPLAASLSVAQED